MRLQTADGNLNLCKLDVHESLNNIFGTCLDVGHDRRVRLNGECWLRTGRDTHSTRGARVSFVEAAGVKSAERFRHLVASTERIGVGESPALV